MHDINSWLSLAESAQANNNKKQENCPNKSAMQWVKNI